MCYKDATNHTKDMQAKVASDQDYMSHASQQMNAEKGLICKSQLTLPNVFDASQYDFLHQQECPDTVHPALWEHAKLNMNMGLYRVNDPEQITEGQSIAPRKGDVFQIRGYDIANMTLVMGDTGWIILDVLTTVETAGAAFAFVSDNLGTFPIRGVVYSHSHLDHYGGIAGLISESDTAIEKEAEQVLILAPEGFMHHAISENVLAGNAMQTRGVYMYGTLLPKSPQGQVDAGLGKATATGKNSLIAPTEELSLRESKNGKITRTVDGLELEFQITPGTEAPAEMNVYVPESKILFIAENCTGTMHNIYTLRGAEIRDSLAWADYLEETIGIFHTLVAVCSSHNWPHFGREESLAYLALQRDLYRYIHNATLNLMNHGYTIAEVGRLLELPEEIKNEWCNHGFYGTINHNAKAVYQKYLGWYDGNPANLNKMLPTVAAKRYVECMGGGNTVLEYAKSAFEEGEYAWAAELLNHLIFAQPDNSKARQLQADTLEQLGYQSESAPWRNEYLTAAMVLRRQEPLPRRPFLLSETTASAMSGAMYMQYMGILFRGMEAAKAGLCVTGVLQLTEAVGVYKDELVEITASRGVLNYRLLSYLPENTTPFILSKNRLYEIICKTNLDDVPLWLAKIVSFLDSFQLNFPIVLPR